MTIPQNATRAKGWSPRGRKGDNGNRVGVYAHVDDHRERSTLYFTPRRKDDKWFWENRKRPALLSVILGALAVQSASKLSFKGREQLSTIEPIVPKTTKAQVAPKTTIPAIRITLLSPSEWKSWSRRLRRDAKKIPNLRYWCSIPQPDGWMAVVTHDFFTPIGGRVYEGEAAREALGRFLDSHDVTKRIRGRRGMPVKKESPTWRLIATSLDEEEVFRKRLEQARAEGLISNFRESQQQEGFRRFNFRILGDVEIVDENLELIPKHARRIS